MTFALLCIGVLYIVAHGARISLAWRHQVVGEENSPSITVLQPILSGDPSLGDTLAVGPRSSPDARFIWLVDTDDPEGQRLAQRIAEGCSNIEVLEGRPPEDGENPKTLKLIHGEALSSTQTVAVLDDDTTLPAGGLEALAAEAYARKGLATALPTWGRTPQNAAEALVAGFVDGQGASAYLSMARLGRNKTINGMAYAADAQTLQRLGGFFAMGHAVTDDWAVAQLFTRHGHPIVQTAIPAQVAVTVSNVSEAIRLLRRWTVFAHRYVSRNIDAAMVCLVLLPAILPLAGLVLAAALGPVPVAFWLVLLAARAWLHLRLVRNIGGTGAAPFWAIVVSELLLPILSLLAAVRPNRIRWRSRRMTLDGDRIRYE